MCPRLYPPRGSSKTPYSRRVAMAMVMDINVLYCTWTLTAVKHTEPCVDVCVFFSPDIAQQTETFLVVSF
jgi:hypothetical protein